ncbi:MAG: molecular chaperone DnaK [Thermoplasmata archaeon]|nr:MAG: molecular chaperone DnaK [Thermoplasmata archaeon]
MSRIIGIDLGTSNSAAAIMDHGRPLIIPSAEGTSVGGKAFPSIVAFTKDGQRLVGEPARRQAIANPERTVLAIKRKMGTKHKVKIDDKKYTPEEISSMILRKIKEDAENFLSEKIDKAVITTPAYFNDDQRQATKDAGTIAGLEVVRIINEPTAASLAYGLDKEEKELKIAVVDLGGGTFDVTMMQMGGGVFEVKSTSGDTQLGGTDMDNAIIDDLVDAFKEEHGIDLREDKSAIQRIREGAEKAKIELTNTVETEVNLPFISASDDGPIHHTYKLTRAKMEDLISDVLDKLKPPMRQAIKDAKFKKKDIDRVVLVGGPTRMPIVKETFKEFFKKEPERGIDPMECVAMGAAIQGGVLSGEVKKDLVLLDVTPLSLGIETLGGVFTRLIDRNTIIPTKKGKVFSTASDNQPAVDINVLQGEREMADDNKSLGKFSLVGIPPAPRGVPQIEVTFEIDANGILNVTAKDMATGNEQDITITGSSHLSDDDKERMINEAEQHAEEDKKYKEQAEIKNRADTLLHTVRRSMKEHEDKLDSKKRKDVEKAMEKLEKALKDNDMDAIKDKEEALSKVSQDLFAAMYADAAKQRMAEEGGEEGEEEEEKPTSAKGKRKKSKKKKEEDEDENVVDVDYEDVDED